MNSVKSAISLALICSTLTSSFAWASDPVVTPEAKLVARVNAMSAKNETNQQAISELNTVMLDYQTEAQAYDAQVPGVSRDERFKDALIGLKYSPETASNVVADLKAVTNPSETPQQVSVAAMDRAIQDVAGRQMTGYEYTACDVLLVTGVISGVAGLAIGLTGASNGTDESNQGKPVETYTKVMAWSGLTLFAYAVAVSIYNNTGHCKTGDYS